MKSCTCDRWFSNDIPGTIEELHKEYAIDHNIFGNKFDLSLMKSNVETVLYIQLNNIEYNEYKFTITRYMR